MMWGLKICLICKSKCILNTLSLPFFMMDMERKWKIRKLRGQGKNLISYTKHLQHKHWETDDVCRAWENPCL